MITGMLVAFAYAISYKASSRVCVWVCVFRHGEHVCRAGALRADLNIKNEAFNYIFNYIGSKKC